MTGIQSCNVTVMVTDLDNAINFYHEILGLKLLNRFGNHWADLEGPGIRIGLHPTDKKITPGENLQIGLKVSDLKNAVSELENKGVIFEMNTGDEVKIAFFKDPDNNTLYLIQ